MADIAILVAEEYERRMKNPGLQAKQKQEIDGFASGVSISATATTGRMKQMLQLGKPNADFKWVSEPKSQIGRAASAGFFSA
ncbi:uncharacterized protein LOC111005739 [Momordica charantia]|uniref:Uncharacterized protein LOC111005739 n=1 Tax=Momordica charantia TaxID=3673 RepID=A0A6J1BTY3_MOMCH|nr:uncharacterized protein LOC111005739 [Momordica charantia]